MERDIQNKIRLTHSKGDCRLFNNDNGTAQLRDGKTIRYGLCKSSPDLVGFKTITITSGMVGKDVAIFIGAEVKIPHKYATQEQQTFLDMLTSAGAIAGVVRSVEDVQILFDKFMASLQSP